jgi:hypothetical protein
MRITKPIAVAAAGLSLAAAAALPAAAGAAHHAAAHPSSKGTFKSTVSPTTVHNGQTITLKAHGAKPKTDYTCVLTVTHGSNYALGPHSILGTKKSSKHGKFTCSTIFHPFSGSPVNGGPKRHCPTTKADRRAGWKCGFAASTLNKKSNTISYFTAKK